MKQALAICVLVAAVASGRVAATDYWVDPNGLGGPCDDGGAGITVESPLCRVEACVAKGLVSGDRCILREAAYAALPVPEDDGSTTAPIVFARYALESVVIGGPDGERVLDLAGRADLRYEGLTFWNVLPELTGARRIAFHACSFDQGGADPVGLADETSPREPVREPRDVEGPGRLSAEPRSGGVPPTGPLSIEEGGTGATAAAQARVNLGAAAEDAAVHRSGDEVIDGAKTFAGDLFVRRTNGVRHSTQFPSIAACLADLSGAGGVCEIDPFEDDPVRFAETNPGGRRADGTSTGAARSVVVDTRGGQMKWLSSGRPPWGSGATAASAADVPFVFQVRYHDSLDLMADNDLNGIRDGDSWSCNVDLKTCAGGLGAGRFCAIDADCGGGTCSIPSVEEWRTCPTGHSTGGKDLRDPSWWYTGQCNANPHVNHQRQLCGGQSILEVRYPQIDDGDGVWEAGEHVDKPIFKVGTHGVGIYFPETENTAASGILTVFRSNDNPSWSTLMKNKPFFSVHRGGTSMDGGLYVGNTNGWPHPFNEAAFEHDPFIAWFHHDIAANLPAMVVEGPNNHDYAFEVGPLLSVYSRAGYVGSHKRNPGVNQEIALEVTANGDVVLGATCPSDDDGAQDCVGTMADSQRIVWQGSDPRDGKDTFLHVVDPTGVRHLHLPDQSGFLAVAGGAATRIECGTVALDAPDLPAGSTVTVSLAAPAVLAGSACACSPPGSLHDDVLAKGCAVGADGTLLVSLYNLAGRTLDDGETPAGPWEFCCVAK